MEDLIRFCKYPCDTKYFLDIKGEGPSYWLGFLYADGSNMITKNGDRKINVCSNIQDESHILKFRDAIASKQPLTYLEPKTKKFHNRIIHSGRICYLTINSVELSRQLESKGCIPKKTLNLKFPKFLMQKDVHHFIRGYFDGDGSIFRYFGKTNFHYCFKITSNKTFLKSCIEILSDEVGVNPNITIEKARDSEVCSFKYTGNQQVLKIFHYLYDDATIFLERKYKKFLEISQYCKK